jgi:four helix bundle protein
VARGSVKGYQELIAWQKAMDLVVAIYEVTRTFPAIEVYGLTGQIRRAAVSVPSNIAEGQGRASMREFAHHLSIAPGTLCEVETQLHIAQRLRYVDEQAMEQLLASTAEVGHLIQGLSRSLNNQIAPH